MAEIQLPLKRSSRSQRLFPNPSWFRQCESRASRHQNLLHSFPVDSTAKFRCWPTETGLLSKWKLFTMTKRFEDPKNVAYGYALSHLYAVGIASRPSLSLQRILFYLWKHSPWTLNVMMMMDELMIGNCSGNPSKTEFLVIGRKQQRLKFALIAHTIYKLSAMISSQSIFLLTILVPPLSVTFISLIKSILYLNPVIFTFVTFVEFVIFSLHLYSDSSCEFTCLQQQT